MARDLSQHAAHDLPRAGLGQTAFQEDDGVRHCDAADILSDLHPESGDKLWRWGETILEATVRKDALAFDIMRHAYNRGLDAAFVRNQCALDLRGAETMAGNVQHIINTARDPVVSVTV